MSKEGRLGWYVSLWANGAAVSVKIDKGHNDWEKSSQKDLKTQD